jgi:hypothetical protein
VDIILFGGGKENRMRAAVWVSRPPLPILASIAAILLAAGIGAFSVPAGAADEPAILAKVEVPTREAWRDLYAAGAWLHFKGSDYAVVSIQRESARDLDERGLEWSELQRVPNESLFYVMYEGPGDPAHEPVLPANLNVLLRDDDGVLVFAGKDRALDARMSGLKVMPLGNGRPLSTLDFIDLDFVHDEATPLLDYLYLTRRVNADSIAAIIQHLENYGTRYAYTQQVNQAGQWLLRRLWNYGYPDTLLQSVELEGKVSLAPGNVIATKPGATVPQYRILVGGHYDSISSRNPGAEAPGADDNGSGTAGALEVARLLAGLELDATVEFVLFTAEEIGLLGSTEYVAQLVASEVPVEHLFFINMDMIGNSGAPPYRTKIFYNNESEPFARLMANVGEVYSDTTPFLAGPTGRSDHVPFWQFNYPAILVHEMDFSPQYHSSEDKLEHMEPEYEAEVIKMVLGTVLHLANIAEPPEDVAARVTESGELLVEWAHSPDADLLGYKVEVVDTRGGVIYETYTRDNFALLDPSGFAPSSKVQIRPEDVLGFGEATAGVLVGSGQKLIAGATPNPVTYGCSFEVFVPGAGGGDIGATITIVDALGRQVAEAYRGPLVRGSNAVLWDGKTAGGDRLPGGVYFYVVDTAAEGKTGGKLMMVR